MRLMAFVHEPLDRLSSSIRVLHILPGNTDEEINCTIDNFSASEYCPARDTFHYCAVSYTWGNPGDVKSIRLNNRRFPVRSNLWSLLFHLRARKESRGLWIDAICIDQSSLEERNHQVGLMGDIYGGADGVLVWLGEADANSDLAFEFIRQPRGFFDRVAVEIPISVGFTFPWTWLRRNRGPRIRTVLSEHRLPIIEFEAVLRLCERDYWNRTWIIQEIVLAKNIEVLCGHQRMHGQDLEDFAVYLQRQGRSENQSIPLSLQDLRTAIDKSLPFRLLRQRLKRKARYASLYEGTYPMKQSERPWQGKVAKLPVQSDRSTSLTSLVKRYRKTQCMERRDKVYALLSLASDHHAGIDADYAKPVVQLYGEVMELHVQSRPWDSSKRVFDFAYFIQKLLAITDLEISQFMYKSRRSRSVISARIDPLVHPYWRDFHEFFTARIGTIRRTVRLKLNPSFLENVDTLNRPELPPRLRTTPDPDAEVLLAVGMPEPPLIKYSYNYNYDTRFLKEAFYSSNISRVLRYHSSLCSSSKNSQYGNDSEGEDLVLAVMSPTSSDAEGMSQVAVTCTGSRIGDVVCQFAGTRTAFVLRRDYGYSTSPASHIGGAIVLESLHADDSEIKYLRNSQMSTAAFEKAAKLPVRLSPLELAVLTSNIPGFDRTADQCRRTRTTSQHMSITSGTSSEVQVDRRNNAVTRRSSQHSLVSSRRSDASELYHELFNVGRDTPFATF